MIFRSFSSILAAALAFSATSVAVAQTWEQHLRSRLPPTMAMGPAAAAATMRIAPMADLKAMAGRAVDMALLPAAIMRTAPMGRATMRRAPAIPTTAIRVRTAAPVRAATAADRGDPAAIPIPASRSTTAAMASLIQHRRPRPMIAATTAGPGPGEENTYNQNEIVAAGHGFFGAVSKGLASAVEYAFKSQGRPNGYILGEDAGGAFVVGLRYGEGRLFTKDAGEHKIYWQGPSLGYDAGAEGSKTMVLVYNLRDPSEIFNRFRRRRRLRVSRRRRQRAVPDVWRREVGNYPVGCRCPSRRQHWISQVYPHADMESAVRTCAAELAAQSNMPERSV